MTGRLTEIEQTVSEQSSQQAAVEQSLRNELQAVRREREELAISLAASRRQLAAIHKSRAWKVLTWYRTRLLPPHSIQRRCLSKVWQTASRIRRQFRLKSPRQDDPREQQIAAESPQTDAPEPCVRDGQRILVACHELVMTGGLLRFERMGNALRRQGHTLAFLTLAESPSKAEFRSSHEVLTLNEARQHEWDAVMIPGAGFSRETVSQFAELRDERFGVRVQHVLRDQSRREAFLRVNRAFDPQIVIFNNEHWPTGSFTEFQADRFHVLLGAVDPLLFFSQPERSHPVNSGQWVIGAQARKNPGPLLDSLEVLPDDVVLKLYGQDRYDIAESHAALVESGRIQLCGSLRGEELRDFYHSVDCVVMAETAAGWANIVAESMACGVPVVCTPHGTTAFARHNDTALLMESPSADVIARYVTSLMTDGALCRRLAASAKEAMSAFSLEDYTLSMLELIRHDGKAHYLHDPSSGLYGKWPLSERLSELQPLLDRANGLSVVDFGAAEGFVGRELLKAGADYVHGFEIDADRVCAANDLCGEWESTRFRQADLSEWDNFQTTQADLLRPAYDIVLYLGIQHHLPEATRKTFLLNAIGLARRFFAVRTSAVVYESDGIDRALQENGFRLLHAESPDESDQHLGTARIYERQAVPTAGTTTQRQLVSYPKSGRSWIRYMLTQLDLDQDIRFHHDGFEFNDGNCPPLDFDVARRIEEYSGIDKVVYLDRDPRDVMVSLYHQVTGRFQDFFNYKGSISEFIRDGYFGAENLQRFRGMWEEICAESGFLRISYEECHRDAESVLRRILDYYQFEVPTEGVRKAVENAEFSRMQQLEQSEEFPKAWLRPRNGAPKVRRGLAGGYRDDLAPDDIAFLNDVFQLECDTGTEPRQRSAA